jgi:hypothetical protein
MSVILYAVLGFFSFSIASSQSTADFNYIGGIPLRTPGDCPAGSVSGQFTFQQNCCGANQTFVNVEGSVCCNGSQSYLGHAGDID